MGKSSQCLRRMGIGEERTGPMNDLVLPIPDSSGEDFADMRGCEVMMST